MTGEDVVSDTMEVNYRPRRRRTISKPTTTPTTTTTTTALTTPQYIMGLDAKVVVMGNTGVGKTSLVQRYTEDKFSPTTTTSTTGAFFVTKKVFVNGLKVRLQIWDTAGQERFRSMAPMYYRGANAALLVYDITNASTFQDVKVWLDELKKNTATDLVIYIIGAKADLSRRRAVTLDLARQSLRSWYPSEPPPAPPPPRPAPQQTSSTLLYIRPRFPSLTTSRSVPFVKTVPSPPPPDPPTSQSLIGSGVRPNGVGGRDPQRRWSQGTLLENDEMNEGEDAQNGEDGSENNWSLPKGIELFEVSAKDGQGVQNLFHHLLSSIIARRDQIEAERERRERDSVMLHDPIPTWAEPPGGTAVAQGETTSAGWGGGCC